MINGYGSNTNKSSMTLVYFGQTGRIITEALILWSAQLSSSPFYLFLLPTQILYQWHQEPHCPCNSVWNGGLCHSNWSEAYKGILHKKWWREWISNLLTWYEKRMMPTSISDMVTIVKVLLSWNQIEKQCIIVFILK